MKLSLHLLWFDFWVGLFWDRAKRTLHFCPLPCVVFRLQLRPRPTPLMTGMASATFGEAQWKARVVSAAKRGGLQ